MAFLMRFAIFFIRHRLDVFLNVDKSGCDSYECHFREENWQKSNFLEGL